VLRYPIIRRELDNILKDLIPLTYDYPTALSTHLVLEQVIEIQCMLAKSTDEYGFAVTDESVLRVANTPNTQFLLQAELRAIHQGLQYKEMQLDEDLRYQGYVDQEGQLEGVGIIIHTSGYKDYGEWHLNNPHCCGKVEFADGNTTWGEIMEGYGTLEGTNGDIYIG
jgi:hypothetical protein